jgi:hypothetical protein
MSDLVKLLRAAGHNETLASGELYLAAADRISELEARIEMAAVVAGDMSDLDRDCIRQALGLPLEKQE